MVGGRAGLGRVAGRGRLSRGEGGARERGDGDPEGLLGAFKVCSFDWRKLRVRG